MTDTFNAVHLDVSQIVKEIIIGAVATPNYYEVTLRCRTNTYSHYTAIAAKAGICTVTPLLSEKTHVQNTGTTGDLVLSGTTHTNCSIKEISNAEISKSKNTAWEYTVIFVKDTTT